MTTKQKGRLSVGTTQDGRGLQKGKTSSVIVRQSGYPVNGVFSCGFLRQVYDLLSQPITVDQIAEITESTKDRVRLALHDLTVSGVQIGEFWDGA